MAGGDERFKSEGRCPINTGMVSDNDRGHSSTDRPASAEDWISALESAAAFYTRLPIRVRRHWPQSAILPAIPVIGAAIGLALGLVFMLAQSLGASPLLAAFLTLAASTLLTGALHEDALADTADGFGPSGLDADRRLEIMHDSRIGAYGACALLLSFGIRAAALAEFAGGTGLVVLVAANALSRSALAWPLLQLPSARSEGVAAAQGRPGEADAWLALALGGAIGFLFLLGRSLWGAILAPVAAFAMTVLCTRTMRSAIGGHSGDALGATQQIVEITVLVVCALCIPAIRF